jgi:hypothetical protein
MSALNRQKDETFDHPVHSSMLACVIVYIQYSCTIFLISYWRQCAKMLVTRNTSNLPSGPATRQTTTSFFHGHWQISEIEVSTIEMSSKIHVCPRIQTQVPLPSGAAEGRPRPMFFSTANTRNRSVYNNLKSMFAPGF